MPRVPKYSVPKQRSEERQGLDKAVETPFLPYLAVRCGLR